MKVNINKKFNWQQFVLVVACLILAVVMVYSDKGDFELKWSDKGIKVIKLEHLPNIYGSILYIYHTEKELLDGKDIFSGIISNVTNIRIDFGNRRYDFKAIAEVKIQDVICGDLKIGDTVSVLLPYLVGTRYKAEDTTISSQMREGVSGIFLNYKYDEKSVYRVNGKTLCPLDLAQYGLCNGERGAFIETTNGLQYDKLAYPSLIDAKNLNEVKDLILSIINSTAI